LLMVSSFHRYVVTQQCEPGPETKGTPAGRGETLPSLRSAGGMYLSLVGKHGPTKAAEPAPRAGLKVATVQCGGLSGGDTRTAMSEDLTST
jgi:hypothetical protein